MHYKEKIRVEELRQRANHIADQIAEANLTRLWYVYDTISAELYQYVMWYNETTRSALVIHQDFSIGRDLDAECYGRVFQLCHYTIE